jgi:hypothetical protein
MMDDSPADDNDRPYDYADANDPADDDDGTFPVPIGYTWTDVHGVKRVIGKGWFPG